MFVTKWRCELTESYSHLSLCRCFLQECYRPCWNVFKYFQSCFSLCAHSGNAFSYLHENHLPKLLVSAHSEAAHTKKKKYKSVVWLDTDYFNNKHTGECVSCWFNSHLFTEILRTHASCVKCLGVLHDQWTIQVLREQWGPGGTQRKLPSLSESTELLQREGRGDHCKRKPDLTWH